MTEENDEQQPPVEVETEKEEKKKDDNPAEAKEGIYISLDNYSLQEASRVVNSPRSLEACKMEGILPEELLYK